VSTAATVSTAAEPLASAYRLCEALARSHYENFPVASYLLPSAMRPHIAAVYAFARVADDIADEGQAAPNQRRAELQVWQDRVHRAAVGAITHASDVPYGARDDQIALALGHSIRSLDLPVSLFDDLLSAFGQDTMTTRYASWGELFDYCRRSANPIGRLVLQIAGYRDEALARSSDALCTALQLTNFWQDFGRDWRAGRLYVPQDVLLAAGAHEADLPGSNGTPAVLGDAWCAALTRVIEVTRAKFQEGRLVCDRVRGRLRLELRATWLGGVRILNTVERQSARLMIERPTLGLADAPWLIWRLMRWRHGA
jgi:squalene synthase HpnC